MPKSLQNIIIYGNSISANQVALALTHTLDEAIEITLVRPPIQSESDVNYGGIMGPEAYDFHLKLGITEPELFIHTDTTFSWGTHYANWTNNKLDWLQTYHLPFSTDEGVDFHQLLTRHKETLADHLIATQAGLAGRFAHPPSDNPASALSRAQYGYHFEHVKYCEFLASKLQQTSVKLIQANVKEVLKSHKGIESLTLSGSIDKHAITADFYIDCSGSERKLLSVIDDLPEHQSSKQLFQHDNERTYFSKKEVVLLSTDKPLKKIEGSERQVSTSIPLANKTLYQTYSQLAPADKESVEFALGYAQAAWFGNCVGISHTCAMLSPLSTAPFKLLEKDISRLLELVPIDENMQMESREYNRRYLNDTRHAALFNKALYDERHLAKSVDIGNKLMSNELLDRKITQFLSRGTVVSYDLEPFNPEDWLTLHFGMQRQPSRYDRLVDQLDSQTIRDKLEKQKSNLRHLASQMPPHQLYREKFVSYLKGRQ